MSNVLSISAIELVEKLKSGEISCVDACKEYIKRIDKFDKEVKAWAFFDKKLLLEKAEEKDEYRKSGKPLGPLHGLPNKRYYWNSRYANRMWYSFKKRNIREC